MLIFPIIYVLSFLWALKELWEGRKQGVLFFIIFGLSIYTISLSVTHLFGMGFLISYLQPFKEIIILATLGLNFVEMKNKIKFHFIDYLLIFYFVGSLIYALLPIGDFGLGERLIALKSTTFFTLIYAAGRTFNLEKIQISKFYKFILVITIAAVVLVLYEFLTQEHFQTKTGYADFNFYFFDQAVTGNYGLTWTFETETGLKRFASFFANPLEYAGATLISLSCVAGLYTNDRNKLKIDSLGWFALLASIISIILALSRASFVSYFLMVYCYALITKNRLIVQLFHILFILVAICFCFLLTNEDVYDFVMETITFKNASSLGHIIEWLTGLLSMLQNPFGLGLGSSGRLTAASGLNVGGENQFIIIGVQLGVLFFLVYIILQISLIYYPAKWFKKLKGKEKKIALTLFLLKVGSIIPLLTSEFESYIYVSYICWFITGVFVDVISKREILHEN